jgi:hypothetical protein
MKRPAYIAIDEDDLCDDFDRYGQGGTPVEALVDWMRQYSADPVRTHNGEPAVIAIYQTKKRPPTFDGDFWIFTRPTETVAWTGTETVDR